MTNKNISWYTEFNKKEGEKQDDISVKRCTRGIQKSGEIISKRSARNRNNARSENGGYKAMLKAYTNLEDTAFEVLYDEETETTGKSVKREIVNARGLFY